MDDIPTVVCGSSQVLLEFPNLDFFLCRRTASLFVVNVLWNGLLQYFIMQENIYLSQSQIQKLAPK